MSTKLRSTAFAIAALALSGTAVFAAPANVGLGLARLPALTGHLTDGTFTVAPNAFNTFCDNYADQCAASGDVEPVVMNVERWAELNDVNGSVNRNIRPDYNADLAVWKIGTGSGACNEYAIEKRKELIERGWPSAALALTVVYTPSREAHLVVTVKTDRGDFVLDNLRNYVAAAERTGYRFVARQSSVHPRLWVMIDGVSHEPVVIAKAPKTEEPAIEPVKAAEPVEMLSAEAANPAAEQTVAATVPAEAPAADAMPVGSIPQFADFALRLATIEG